MKVYKAELLIIDFDGVGESLEEMKHFLETIKYLHPTVMDIKEADIGEWTDDHPLNKRDQAEEYYKKLFK